jgi:short-subunit dehydrogenase
MPNAIIIGASSGIGRALARVLANHGYRLGLAARRLPLLAELQNDIGAGALIRKMDVADAPAATALLTGLIDELGGVDLIVISAGTGFLNPDLEWEKERDTIAVNVAGFTAIATTAIRYFIHMGTGHLVNLSSLAALRGGRHAPGYNASKAYSSNYMEGLRQKVGQLHLPIMVTDVQLGFVDTAMAQGDRLFWVASPEKAALQIYRAIKTKKKHAYVTRRWALFAFLMKHLPTRLYDRM